jgi:uncharacterized membrane protein
VAGGSLWERWARRVRRAVRPFLSRSEKERISRAIAEAEERTTGEIRVHVAADCAGRDPLEAAKALFRELGMHRTEDRNGVLILVSHLDHRFAIWGDEGLHSRAGQGLWDGAARSLREAFARRRYAEGIEACVREVGEELARAFPKAPGPGMNRIPDDVTES